MVRYISSLVLILISVAMSTTSLSAQHTGHNHEECGTMHIDAEMRKKNPEMGTLKDFEMWMGPLYRRQKRKAQYRSVVTLPVVFHIIHHNDAVGSGQNWANSFIQEQMTQLNDDFRKRPGTAGFNNNPVGADTEIEFCLATVKPDGTPLPEPGVNRINAADSSWINGPYNSNFINNTIKPNTIYDPNNYINIWVCELDGNLLGFAQLPGASTLPGLQTSDSVAETDGVVIDGSTMGSVANPNSANINYGVGRTLTHELGHFFGLRHIWGDGDCNVDDYCDDTPDQSGPTTFTTNCPSDKTSCGSRDMYENYMDYTNDLCVNIFTLDQKARMDVVLANSPRRGSLINSTACQPLGGPVANFIADKVLIRAGETITFTDQSLGNPTNWSWTINGGTPSASTDQNPVVVFNTVGTYTVSLTVSNNEGSNTITKTNYISVSVAPPPGAGCLNGIAAFPYQESFESGLGGWSQSFNDDIDWTLQSGGTPSTGTGPTAANNGNNYLFTEASGSSTDATATLTSPCFDLNNQTSASFEFYYHMFGTNMGSLNLEISTDDEGSWSSIWTQSGDQGTQWNQTIVDLTSYTGMGGIKLRFVGLTGPAFRSDMAIDNITLSTTTGGGGTAPVADFIADQLIIQEGGSINFTDLSTNSPTSWNWTFNGGNPANSNQQNPTVTYNTAGIYTVSLNASNADGSDTETKTNYITVNVAPVNACVATVNNYPYAVGFENGLGDWSQSSGDNINWTVNSNGTPSSSTGPTSASQGVNYLYTEASNGNDNSTAILESPCFEILSQANLTFDFDYHMYGSNMGSLSVEISDNNGTSWTQLWSRSGDQGNQWNQASIDLSAYDGKNVQFRIIGLTGSSFRSDIAIDNISMGGQGGGGGNPTPPVADFTADRVSIQEGESINFSDLSTNNPSSWSWTFSGGNPANSNQQNPTVTYAAAGTYTVVLTSTNSDGSDTETKTNYITVSATPPPPPSGNGCTGGITSFPFGEGFENGIGLWTQSNNDDIDWLIESGSTPSSSTGPSSAFEGNDYLFTEASGSNSNSTAILTSPCLDLSNQSNAGFNFSYHMYGSDMGSLSIEVSADDGSTWTSIWSESGNKGDQWNQANISLSLYAGQSIQLRFVGRTGSSFRSDMAIDNISFSGDAGGGGGNPTPPAADFTADRINIQEGERINFSDLSTNNPTSWSWTFNGGSPGNSNQENPTITYSTAGTYTVILTVTNSDGSDTETKTNYITVSTTPPPPPPGSGCTGSISSFPYSDGFENGLGGWTQDTNDDMNWTSDSNNTPSSSTGPSSAAEGNDYLYTEASNGNSNSTAILTSPCFDLNGQSNADFNFAYHMYGSNMGSLTVEISADDGGTWTSLWSESGDKGNQWNTATISLSTYANQSVQLRFVGLTGSSFRSDMAIDDISITSGGSGGGNPTPPTADFTADRVSIQEGESINFTDLSTNNPTSWSWTFNGGSPSTSNQQNPSVSYATAGTYTVSLTVTNADGNDTETKTNYITVSTTPPPPNGNGCTGGINSFPYAEGFESNLGGWIQASNDGIDWIRDANGTSSSSTGPNSATEGNLYLYTEASNGNSNSTAILTSPCFDLSNQANATFNFAYHMYGSDMGSLMVEVSTNGGSSWVSLWSESGDKGNQWKTASISLSPYAGQSIQLRFVGLTGPSFRSDMAIDDISITSGGNGGGNPTPPVADFSADRFTIQEGQSINFTDLSTNNPTSWSWTFNGGTPGTSNQQNPTVSYSTAGIYTVVLTVTNADGSDTETKTNYITVSTTPPPPNGNGCTGGITNFPYSEGFENGLGGWIQASNDDMDWTIDLNGTPSSSTGPSSAIEGNDYLYTEASGGNSNSTAILTSPCFDLSNIVSATFSFGYHMYGSNMGTLTVQISNDDGANWTDLWQESGNKGNQWLSANLNLDSYAGGTIQVRFVGLTGSSFRSDMAIDNINLTASSARLANAEVKPGKENKETYRVYPNPTRNNLLLEMTSANYGPLTIIITDIMGRELIRQKLEQNPGFNSYNIDVSGFDAGTYILIALDDEKRVIERFIKKN